MTQPLSPAAQAVNDAAFGAYWSTEVEAPNDHNVIAAAALRALADQVVPVEHEEIDNCWYRKTDPVREQILAIAAELEGG